MNTLHVKKGDTVVVLAGKEKGKTGRIIECNPKDSRVQVEDINLITRHKKARSAQDSGGRLQDAGFIHSSNVQIVCQSCNKPTRIAKSFIDGEKVRTCKHCNASLDIAKKADKKDKKKSKEVASKKTEKKLTKKDN